MNKMLALLKKHFGYDRFRPLQKEIIENVISKKDALVLMPTGGGKSLCYQLPALMLPGMTLVVSPLISLMKDQVDVLQANGIKAAFLNSTLSYTEIDRIKQQALGGDLKILYLAPERLALPNSQEFIANLQVSLIAVDEAHCISEWGHEFRPDYRNLKILRDIFPEVPVIALTATATPKVRLDILEQLEIKAAKTFLASFNRPNLTYLVRSKINTLEKLFTLLEDYKDKSVIIYCFSRKETEGLAADLNEAGFSALPYHAGLDNTIRKRTQEKFIRDEIQIIVATIAFGMGIDKPDVRLVVHYSLPKSIEGYYQETGRAGRDGLPSECVLFYSYGDKLKQDFFIRKIENLKERVEAERKLEKMINFCELQICRRKFLLEYFGEDYIHDNCKACDFCLSPREEFDATEISQKILSAVLRTKQRFGANHIIAVLKGSNSRRIVEHGHDKLSVFGIVNDFSEEELKQIVKSLLEHGLLAKDDGKYPTLSVTNQGQQILKMGLKLNLPKPRVDSKFQVAKASEILDYDQVLFAKLRELRKQLADERNVPPFVIFGDAALQEMAYYLPHDQDDFLRISGVGRVKLAEFGISFLQIIREYSAEHDLKPRRIPRPRHRSSGPTKHSMMRKGSSYDETRQLLMQKLSIAEIAKKRDLSESTITEHLEKLVAAGVELEIDHLRPVAERFIKIRAAFLEHGLEKLSPVKQVLGDDYSYDELKLVRVLMIRDKV